MRHDATPFITRADGGARPGCAGRGSEPGQAWINGMPVYTVK